ncbi:MAG: hypothetical protein GX442_25500 [Candidatus Riflebacteria bacterium]|nr:hypothetical protein [Candidatus Riflebacteria bacterium]
MFRSAAILKNLVLILALSSAWLSPGVLLAHCDTFAGPVLIEARKALETGDVTPLLKWVKPDREEVIKKAFAEASKNRKTGQKEADHAFFEILIRIHREGEGAPFTGIKPAGTELPPAVVAADQALETGSAKALIDLQAKDLAGKVQARYDHALAKKRSAARSVAQGREFVAAYVEYVHFVEALSGLLAGEAGPHHEGGEPETGTGPCSSCDSHGK